MTIISKDKEVVKIDASTRVGKMVMVFTIVGLFTVTKKVASIFIKTPKNENKECN